MNIFFEVRKMLNNILLQESDDLIERRKEMKKPLVISVWVKRRKLDEYLI